MTAKALVFDDNGRLLLVINGNGGHELPGGGMEHGESFMDCLHREVEEELHAQIARVGEICCVYTQRSAHGNVPVVRIAAVTELVNHDFRPDDTIVDYLFVTKDEFLTLDMSCEGNIQDFTDTIWKEN